MAKDNTEETRTDSVADTNSALRDNIDKKGSNAYYYAHNRSWDVPDSAKVVSGPGLITGGPPEKIVGEADKIDDSPAQFVKDYSWADGKEKLKVYVSVPEGTLPAEGAEELVETKFESNMLDMIINSYPKRRLRLEKLNAEILPEQCSTRVEAKKNRIVIVLAKKRPNDWFNLTKKA
eukprot:gnl/TRDRNA2_/TRDRNA2_180850_c0_seq1.p1 gnl/TRDRNA2_/TRDRNA2_180850_c0~~gnl/TRDRNA2_/TRDRNA2_180850_c0_seq1.p1  ORF type:complete len:177 (+),score=44.69 gnl/TRDRNA2_/TRDRNA2_180850_c0_seq1:82-612(+)